MGEWKVRSYFDKHKHSMFPEITDWTSHHEQYRYDKDPGRMKFKLWLFFHPTAYLISMLGMNVMTFLLFGGASIWLFFRGWAFLAVIPAVISLGGLLGLNKNLKNYGAIKRTTFYDIWMREW